MYVDRNFRVFPNEKYFSIQSLLVFMSTLSRKFRAVYYEPIDLLMVMYSLCTRFPHVWNNVISSEIDENAVKDIGAVVV